MMLNDKKEKSISIYETSNIFEKHYHDYCTQIEQLDLESIKDTLGLKNHGDGYSIPYFNKEILISSKGILSLSDNRPDYMVSVIIWKYILLCPPKPKITDGWASFKDFKKAANFVSAGAFSTEAERNISKLFSGRHNDLENACRKSGGIDHEFDVPYDLSMIFPVLPRISILLLFNDMDEEFPATCTLLFQKHAEYYLDPESLVMIIGSLLKNLKNFLCPTNKDRL